MKNILRHQGLCLFLIIALGFTAYSFILGADFKTLDDEASIVSNVDIQSLSNVKRIFLNSTWNGGMYYRPLVEVTYMLEYHLAGLNPLAYNLTNILLLLLSGTTAFFLIRVLLKRQDLAFFVSLLYVIHPIQWEAVANIAGRPILLCGLFYFNAFLWFYKFNESKNKLSYILSLLFFILALLSKESAVTFPFVLILSGLLVRKSFQGPSREFVLSIVPFFLILLEYLLLRQDFGITVFPYWSSEEMVFGLMAALRALGMYLWLLIFPVGLYFYRGLPIFVKPYYPELFLFLILFIGLLYGLYRYRGRISAVVLFFIGWFFVTILPESNVFPLRFQPGWISTMEHFLYIPSLGVFVLMVFAMEWVLKKGLTLRLFSLRTFSLGVFGLYLFLFIMTVQNNLYASQEIAMYKNSLAHNPWNSRVECSLGLALAKKRLFVEAEQHFRKALLINPMDVRAQIALGKSLCDQGRYEEGLKEYDKIKDAGSLNALLQENIRLTKQLLFKK